MKKNIKPAILGIQHLLAMYAGAIAVPLIIGSALNLSEAQMTYLISIDILMCGVATLLQLSVNRFFGIGLPVVLGCAFQAVAPLIMIGSKSGLGAIYGSIIASGIFIILIAPFFAKIKKFFPKVVTGSVITIIGLTLIPVAMMKIGGGNPQSESFASLNFIGLGFGTIFLIILISLFCKGFLKSIGILIGLMVGTLFASFLGMVDLAPVKEANLFDFPKVFYFGAPKFELSGILMMIIISVISLVESTGVYFALSELTGRKLTQESLKKGYRAEGLAVLLGGIVNTFPYTAYSQNVGLVSISGIKSTRPIYFASFFLILLGLFPKIGALAQIIPDPVLGGGMLIMFAYVTAQGVKILSSIDLTCEKNILIIALSIGLGLGCNAMPQLFAHLPQTLEMIFSNGIIVGSICAVTLNAIFGKNLNTQIA